MLWGVLTKMHESVWWQSAAVYSFGPSHSSRIWNWEEYLATQPERWNSLDVSPRAHSGASTSWDESVFRGFTSKKKKKLPGVLAAASTHCECGGWFVAGWWHNGRQTFKKLKTNIIRVFYFSGFPVFNVWHAARHRHRSNMSLSGDYEPDVIISTIYVRLLLHCLFITFSKLV